MHFLLFKYLKQTCQRGFQLPVESNQAITLALGLVLQPNCLRLVDRVV